MTQSVTTGEPAGQPFGFASPKAPPLTAAASGTDVPPPPASAPDGYAPPTDPVPPLESIAPAPPDDRDPQTPFLDSQPEPEQPVSWTPDQPMPMSAASASRPDPAIDLATLPPPNSPVPANLPPPTGLPVNALPPSPYGPNPYATGPYSTPGQYPAPAGYPPPGYPAAGQPPARPLLQQLDPFVVLLLFVGTLWAEAAPYALIAAASLAAVRKVPGRIVLALCGGLGLATTVMWYLGYIGTGQWLSTSQLMSSVGLIGMVLATRLAMRRPQ